MHTNRLANEKSPYLLQHAHNPVDWFPWGPEAFEKARREDKPIFLSIGYSTCHWCHVMERESFENEAIAALLNRDYVPIKVDREERPDVDRIYMTFVQATTGGGGWPMSVWLTPDLKPFFGGTYFPPETRYGHPGFASILTQIAAAWAADRGQIADSARDIVEQLRQHVRGRGRAGGGHRSRAFWTAASSRSAAPSTRSLGGFGGAPKFPRPSVLNFLLRYYARTKNREALDMVAAHAARNGQGRHARPARRRLPSLLGGRALVRPALREDALRPGAARHLLSGSFPNHRRRPVRRNRAPHARLRAARHDRPEGGFYSAEDADSAIDPAHPDVKGEGAFYIWSAEEIRARTGQPAADWFCYRYGVEEGGNVADDPHGEFTGKNILYQAQRWRKRRSGSAAAEEVGAGLLGAPSNLLLEARSKRVRPHLDDAADYGLCIKHSRPAAGGICRSVERVDPDRLQSARRAGQSPTMRERCRQEAVA